LLHIYDAVLQNRKKKKIRLHHLINFLCSPKIIWEAHRTLLLLSRTRYNLNIAQSGIKQQYFLLCQKMIFFPMISNVFFLYYCIIDHVHDCDRFRLVRFSLKPLCVQIGSISNRLQSFPVITTVHTAHLIRSRIDSIFCSLPGTCMPSANCCLDIIMADLANRVLFMLICMLNAMIVDFMTRRLLQRRSYRLFIQRMPNHRVPRHIWGHGFVKVGDTDLKRRFQVSWCEIINYSIITII
jgi:hypothetical protein